MDRNVQYLYDLFHGCIDRQIIHDVLLTFNCDVNKTKEQLLEFMPANKIPSTGNNSQIDDIALKSTLSATAAEFIPTSFAFGRVPKHNYVPNSALNISVLNQAEHTNSIKKLATNEQRPLASKPPNVHRSSSSLFQKTSDVSLNNSTQKENIPEKNETARKSTVMSQKDAIALVKSYVKNNERVIILLRGCPGSGKSTLARQIRFNGVILSADDFFLSRGHYRYSTESIPDAHEWNKQRAKDALKRLQSPVIIDNTNIQVWEMLPYAAMAKSFEYKLEVIEPGVQWRLKPNELVRKNIHGVKKDKILKMLDRYDADITGRDLLEMVDGKCKDTSKTDLGVVDDDDQKRLRSASESSLPVATSRSDTLVNLSWINMKYGSRSDEPFDDVEGRSEASSCHSKDDSCEGGLNTNADSSWDGVCTTLGEWMVWGEEGNRESDAATSGAPETVEMSLDKKDELSTAQSDGNDDNNVEIADEELCVENTDADANTICTDVLGGEDTAPVGVKELVPINEVVEGSSQMPVVDYFPDGNLKSEEKCTMEDKCIGVEARDLVMIMELEKKKYLGPLDEFQGVLKASKRFSSKVRESSVDLPCRIPLSFSLDKSSQTSDDDVQDDLQQLTLLQSCFPGIDPDHLDFLYRSCGKDTNALAGIMAESGYHYSDPSNKISYVHEGRPAKACKDKKPNRTTKNGTNSKKDPVQEIDPPKDQHNHDSPSVYSADKLLPLTLSPELGEQLLKMFGTPSDFKVPQDGSGYVLQMTVEVAKMIHEIWTGCSDSTRSEEMSSADIQSSVNDSDVELSTVDRDVTHHLSTKIKRQQLERRYPNINKKILENIFEASGFMLDITIKTIESSPELIAPPKSSMTDEFVDNLDETMMQQAIKASLEQPIGSASTSSDGEDEMDVHQAYDEMVEKVEDTKRAYQEYAAKARNSFSSKRFLESNFYASKAHLLRKTYQEEKELCAELLVQKMTCESVQSGSVDLHGLSLKDALDLLPQIISRYRNDLFKKKSHLFVITGRGLHSINGMPKIKPAIINYLKENKYLFYEVTPGILKVNLRSK